MSTPTANSTISAVPLPAEVHIPSGTIGGGPKSVEEKYEEPGQSGDFWLRVFQSWQEADPLPLRCLPSVLAGSRPICKQQLEDQSVLLRDFNLQDTGRDRFTLTSLPSKSDNVDSALAFTVHFGLRLREDHSSSPGPVCFPSGFHPLRFSSLCSGSSDNILTGNPNRSWGEAFSSLVVYTPGSDVADDCSTRSSGVVLHLPRLVSAALLSCKKDFLTIFKCICHHTAME